MSRKGLRRVGGAGAVLLACTALALSTGVVRSTLAAFTGETTNAGSVVPGGWTVAPTITSTVVDGADVQIGWTVGNHGVFGQRLYGADNGSTNGCTGVTYTALANMASATTNSYTHGGIGSGTSNGHYYCYQLLSTSSVLVDLTTPTGWTAAATFGPYLVGFTPTAVAITNGSTSTANRIDGGDKIVLTFNQSTSLTGTSTKVCAVTTQNKIYLGDSATTCGSSDSASIGVLTGKTIGATRTFSSATMAISGTTVTITLPAGTGGTASLSGSGSWVFTPTGTIQSGGTNKATVCSGCTASTTSTF